MHKIKTLIFTAIITIIFFNIKVYVNADYNIPNEIRIGLVNKYFNKPSITIYNSKLLMGYESKSDWLPAMTIEDANEYNLVPLKGYFLISNQSFEKYKEIKKICDNLREIGYPAYPGNQGIGVWKIYMGRYINKDEAITALNDANKSLKAFKFILHTDNKKRYKIQTYKGVVAIIDSIYQYPQFIALDNEGIIDLGERQYRGIIEIGRFRGKGVSAINQIDIEEYLYGVIPAEMIATWNMEALKAQAVAARTYALYNTVESPKYKDKPYDLDDTTRSQVYKGYGVEDERTNKAVEETKGEMLFYDDKLIFSSFFSSSGGHTEDSENVWSGTVPYLKGTADIYELTPEKKPWINVVTKDDIKEKLKKYDINIGNIIDVEVKDYSDSGRAMSVLIIGDKGVKELKKETIRYWLGLSSRKFTLVKKDNYIDKVAVILQNGKVVKKQLTNKKYIVGANSKVKHMKFYEGQVVAIGKENIKNYVDISAPVDSFVFAGMGWGHGVGMSQSGAQGMAQAGFKYDEILKHYYKGVMIKNHEMLFR